MLIKMIALPLVVVVKFATFVRAPDAIVMVDDIESQKYTRTPRAVEKVTLTATIQITHKETNIAVIQAKFHVISTKEEEIMDVELDITFEHIIGQIINKGAIDLLYVAHPTELITNF